MSVNTSEDYLDELLQAIEPIINPEQPNTVEAPIADIVTETTDTSVQSVESEQPLPDALSTDIGTFVESEISMDTVDFEEPDSATEEDSQKDDMLNYAEDEAESASAINDLLTSLAGEDMESVGDEGMSEEDVESMLSAFSSQTTPENEETAYDEDVKELLKQFTEDEDLSDIQDILDKNDNGEALDNSMLDLPDVEVFQLEEDSDDEEETSDKGKKTSNPIGKLIGGFSAFFKRRKNKKQKDAEEEQSLEEQDADSFEQSETESYVDADSELELEDIDSMALEEMLGEDVEDIVFDEDLSDIEQLLSGGTFSEIEELTDDASFDEAPNKSEQKTTKNKKKKDKTEKKESIFAKVLNMLTEEIDEPAKTKSRVPEAGETGVTEENLNILEELSAEDKKKAKKAKKEEKQNKKAKKNGKNAAKKGSDDEEDDGKNSKNKKAQKDKKPKKKRVKKEKPRKVEEITKPEKKLPKRRVISTLALCFSILAAILILQNVVLKADNLKEAQYAFDSGDYATCFANLETVERTQEEESLYQKSLIIMSVQRKWDSYNNFLKMNNEVEALNSLLEGVIAYRNQEDLAVEWGVQGQINAIYLDIWDKLQGYGLTEADVEEILNYESKVTYTKRLDSIVNGTPFVIEEMMENTNSNEPQPLQDVLPGEEDFLPEDTTGITSEAVAEAPAGTEAESQSTGETVVVGSNPVNVSETDPVVTGGQNVGSGNTNVSLELDGQNVIIGDY